MSDERIMCAPLEKVVDWFQALNQLVEEESELSRVSRGGNGVLSGQELLDDWRETRACGDARFAFVAALPDDYLFALMVLMYAGRDERSDLSGFAVELSKTFKIREHVEAKVVEKGQVREFVAAGVARAGAAGASAALGAASRALSEMGGSLGRLE